MKSRLKLTRASFLQKGWELKNLFKKLFDTKFKKFIWLSLATIAILSAVFIRTVPNYSKKYGFEVVSLFDYNKYNQGYCLAENRILPKEELYRRAVGEFLDKEIIVLKKIASYRENDDIKYKYSADYYEMKDLSFENYLEILKNSSNKVKTIEDFYIAELKATTTDPKQYLKVDAVDKIVGFTKPLILCFEDSVFLMLDKNFIIRDNFLQSNSILLFDKIPTEYDLRTYYEKSGNSPKYYFDNCGNIKYDIEKEYLEGRELKGG